MNVKVAIGNGCYDPEGRVLGKLGRLFRTVGFLDSWAPDNRAQLVCRYNIYNISMNIFKNVLSDIDIFKNGGII